MSTSRPQLNGRRSRPPSLSFAKLGKRFSSLGSSSSPSPNGVVSSPDEIVSSPDGILASPSTNGVQAGPRSPGSPQFATVRSSNGSDPRSGYTTLVGSDGRPTFGFSSDEEEEIADVVASTMPTRGANGRPGIQRNGGSLTKRVSVRVIKIRNSVRELFELRSQIDRAAPTAPDGLYAGEAVSPTADVENNTTFLHDLLQQAKQGRVLRDGHALMQVARGSKGPINDRGMMLEDVVEMLASMETGSTNQRKLSSALLTALYTDLPHPPTTLISDAFRFRRIDGSGNNVFLPDIGRAGLPYARTVTPKRVVPGWLPEPGMVFEGVLRRREFKAHPSGISSMLFAFATLVVHTLFRTSRADPSINETSSYLDLSVLYGHDEEHADRVRTYENGTIWPDVWAEPRLLNFPPQVTALLVIFSRNHNYVAEKLLRINEHGKFRDWKELDDEKRKWQDNEIFQTARLINCGFFINIVLHDYLRAILGLNSTTSTFVLDPRVEITSLLGGANGHLPRAAGNHCSTEFNLLYGWHQTLSEADERWTVERFREIFGDDCDFEKLEPREFGRKVRDWETRMSQDPREWSVPGLERGGDGRFDDEQLSKVILDATEEVAGRFGARHVPAVLKIVETLRMTSARDTWRVCSLNEFRKFLNLEPFTKFEQHNSDPEVARTMESIYLHPDNIELYTGLMAEEAKPSRVGSGLCPGYTISRAILSDAVALTRGDRFFTDNFDRGSLTSWGYEDCSSDPNNGAYGGMLGKLLMRALPRAYRLNSVHGLFPFQVPSRMQQNLEKLGTAHKYDFARPQYIGGWHHVTNREAVKEVLSTPDTFGVVYSAAIRSISSKDYGFMLGFDDLKRHDIDRALMDGTVFPPGYIEDYTVFYTETMDRLIRENSWCPSSTNPKKRMVNFVRDCSTMASVYWVARTFGIPLKLNKPGYEKGIVTPQELYLMLTGMFVYVFILPLGDPSIGWELRETSLKSSQLLCAIVKARLEGAKYIPEHLLPGRPGSLLNPGPNAEAFYERMLASGRPIYELVSNCMGIMVASTSNQGELAAHTLNLFLQPEHKDSYDELAKLAAQPIVPGDTTADDKIRAFVWEAMRLDPQTPAVPRQCKKTTQVVDGDKTIDVAAGDYILSSLTAANMDPALFPEPEKVKTDRDPRLYRVFGFGMHTCLGAKIVNLAQPIILRAAFRLKNLERAKGKAGQLSRFTQDVAGLQVWTYIDANSNSWPFPCSLAIEYEVDE